MRFALAACAMLLLGPVRASGQFIQRRGPTEVRGDACSPDLPGQTRHFGGILLTRDTTAILVRHPKEGVVDTIPMVRIVTLEQRGGSENSLITAGAIVGGILGFVFVRPSQATIRRADGDARLLLYPLFGTVIGAVAGGILGNKVEVRQWRAVLLAKGAGHACSAAALPGAY